MTRGIEHAANTKPEIVLIVAMARNRVIGKDGALPWRLPEDLKRFRQLTMGHPIIMGRKTWDSIGRPLPGRRNIVVTRSRQLQLDGAETAASLEDALRLIAAVDTAFVIGGEQLYRTALPLADRIELTLIESDIEGDTWFPEIDRETWIESKRQLHHSPELGHDYSFATMVRKRA